MGGIPRDGSARIECGALRHTATHGCGPELSYYRGPPRDERHRARAFTPGEGMSLLCEAAPAWESAGQGPGWGSRFDTMFHLSVNFHPRCNFATLRLM
jgi:hypothetical protein